MKALILSDIHANYPALQAVLNNAGSYDKLIFLGHVIDYGPNPKECLTFIKENADYYVRGNHDNAMAFGVDCKSMGSFHDFSVATRNWHKTLLSDSDIDFLTSMPVIDKIHLDGNSFVLAHAAPNGNIFKYLGEDEIDNEVNNIIGEFILVGHTHIQYKKKIEFSLITNPGSVGLARDGGKACYAVYENGKVSLYRIDYDVEKTIFDLNKAPILDKYKKELTKILLQKESER